MDRETAQIRSFLPGSPSERSYLLLDGELPSIELAEILSLSDQLTSECGISRGGYLEPGAFAGVLKNLSRYYGERLPS